MPDTYQYKPLAPPPGAYGLGADGGSVTVTAWHTFGLGSVRANLTVMDLRIDVDPEPLRSSVSATIDAATFTSGNSRRDMAIRSRRFLAVSDHPKIDFDSTSLECVAQTWLVHGVVVVRGQGSPCTLAVADITPTPEGVRVRARATLDRRALGITGARGLVRRKVSVELDVIANRMG